MEASHKLDDHLRSPGLSEQFALMVDAHLVADGKLVSMHKSLLAAGSPVFSDLFLTATNSNNSAGTDTFPMPGHTVADICTVLRFLYKRTATVATDIPSNSLWKSVEDARLILQFAHKFNMQTILQECDIFLSRKAEADSEGIFKDNDSTVAWAELAEECGLNRTLASAELFMVKNADPTFWQSPAFNKHKLSSSCMLRMLQAAQLNMNSWSSKFICGIPQDKEWALATCRTCKHSVWCAMCASPNSWNSGKKPEGAHVNLSTLLEWQQASNVGDIACVITGESP